ncbi:MAG: response regulator transcription factor [Mesorhizobium sp.]|uniref:response regulator transcription factor n=1 Tax=Mesorhizobium sp. TaxID=1871066 RepID=UPI000FE2EDD3|nr:response regulator transcription factor [Mesorhizobium sp.]RWO23338.1 MAG: response regulator transcription factor [Mesorhizobium sp.]RWO37293.1 MAG: response regulator transcription factor [Mesorhizobium sp.]
MRVIVLAPSREMETELRAAADDAGFESAGEPIPQELCSALYRDPDSMAVIRSPNSAFAAVTCRDFRKADVRNLLFVLLDAGVWDSGSASLILKCGADDIQPAPIHTDEFVARLKALVRRGSYNDHLFIKMPGCVYDAETGNAEGGGRKKHLTQTEARLLTALALDPSKIFSKADLMDHMYGGEDEPEQKIVDVLVCKLRRKLIEMNDGLDVVRTVWGRGYQFEPKGFTPDYRDARSRRSR